MRRAVTATASSVSGTVTIASPISDGACPPAPTCAAMDKDESDQGDTSRPGDPEHPARWCGHQA